MHIRPFIWSRSVLNFSFHEAIVYLGVERRKHCLTITRKKKVTPKVLGLVECSP